MACFFDRRTDQAAPFGPRAIVDANVCEAEHFGQYIGEQCGAMTEAAIHDRFRRRIQPEFADNTPLQFIM